MRLALLASSFVVAAAVPAFAQAPTFHIGVVCDGPMPVGIHIVARGPGETAVLIEGLLAFCAEHAPAEPQKQHWRSRA
jgi:hypothetical protein